MQNLHWIAATFFLFFFICCCGALAVLLTGGEEQQWRQVKGTHVEDKLGTELMLSQFPTTCLKNKSIPMLASQTHQPYILNIPVLQTQESIFYKAIEEQQLILQASSSTLSQITAWGCAQEPLTATLIDF